MANEKSTNPPLRSKFKVRPSILGSALGALLGVGLNLFATSFEKIGDYHNRQNIQKDPQVLRQRQTELGNAVLQARFQRTTLDKTARDILARLRTLTPSERRAVALFFLDSFETIEGLGQLHFGTRRGAVNPADGRPSFPEHEMDSGLEEARRFQKDRARIIAESDKKIGMLLAGAAENLLAETKQKHITNKKYMALAMLLLTGIGYAAGRYLGRGKSRMPRPELRPREPFNRGQPRRPSIRPVGALRPPKLHRPRDHIAR